MVHLTLSYICYMNKVVNIKQNAQEIYEMNPLEVKCC